MLQRVYASVNIVDGTKKHKPNPTHIVNNDKVLEMQENLNRRIALARLRISTPISVKYNYD